MESWRIDQEWNVEVDREARRGSLYKPRTELGRVLVEAMARWCGVKIGEVMR